MKSGSSLVWSRAQKHAFKATNLVIDDEDDDGSDDDTVFQVAFARPKFSKPQNIEDDDEELSDYVKMRLLIARMKAMKIYDEKWAWPFYLVINQTIIQFWNIC